MIKVIKHGKLAKKTITVYKTKCCKCDCEFEFIESDTFKERKENLISTWIEHYILCPECGQIKILHAKNLESREVDEELVKEGDF